MDEYEYVNPILRRVMKKIYDERIDEPCNYCDSRIERVNNQYFAQLSFVSRGCSHDIKGGCTMCNYGYRKEKSFDYDLVLKGIQNTIEKLPPHLHEFVVEPTGSFLDECEVPESFLIKVLNVLSQVECDEFICETRTDSISLEKAKLLKKFINSPKITLEIGVESTSLWILRNCVNKNSSFDEVRKAIDISYHEDIDICANIGIGFPFVNEKISVLSAVNSIRSMLALDTYCVLFAYNIRPGTLLEWLWKNGLYDCTSLWAIVEVLSHFSDDELKRIQISWYRNYYDDKSKILKMPFLCSDCEEEVLELFDDYRNNPCMKTLQPLIDYDCSCKREWYAHYHQQPDEINVNELERAYKMMGKEFDIPDVLVRKEVENMISSLSRKE